MKAYGSALVMVGIIAALLTACGETFSGNFKGELALMNMENCSGGMVGKNPVTVMVRIDSKEIDLRPLTQSYDQTMSDLNPLIGEFVRNATQFSLVQVGEESQKSQRCQNKCSIAGFGTISEDRRILNLEMEIMRPDVDPLTSRVVTNRICVRKYKVRDALLQE